MFLVKDWASFYEKARTKTVDGPLDWVAVRVNLSSLGYGRLMLHERGPAHFGVWVALLEIAADLPKELRGSICGGDGNAYAIEDIAIKSRMPPELVAEALGRLIQLDWIETDEGAGALPQSAPERASAQEGSGSPRRVIPTEQDNTRQDIKPICASSEARDVDFAGRDRKNAGQVDEMFNEFWPEYSKIRNRDKKRALAAFKRAVTNREALRVVMAALKEQAPEMMRRAPEHRPHCATWLNGRRWEDGVDDMPARDLPKRGIAEVLAELFEEQNRNAEQ